MGRDGRMRGDGKGWKDERRWEGMEKGWKDERRWEGKRGLIKQIKM